MDEQLFNALRKEVREFRTEADDRLAIVEARLDRIEAALSGGVNVTNIVNQAPPVLPAPDATTGKVPSGDDQSKSPAEILAIAADNSVPFLSFKAEAAQLLGSDLPAKKADIVAALEWLASKAEGGEGDDQSNIDPAAAEKAGQTPGEPEGGSEEND